MSSESISDHVSPFDFILALGALIPGSILEIDCMGCSCSYGGKEFIPDLPKGVRHV